MMLRYLFITLFFFILCTKDKPPTVEITTPPDGSHITGQVVIQAIANDDLEVKEVRFFVDDSSIGLDTIRPYLGVWETDTIPDLTIHSITAIASDLKDQTDEDSISLIVDHSLRPPVINRFDTSIVRSTSLWLIWKVVDAETISLYRSLSPNIDTITHLHLKLPASVESIHELWLNQDLHYYYLIIVKDKEGQRARSPIIDVK
ncbi:MAG TPA: hypothetical protein EYP58_03495, partial [bacterium (Candidatus Stahlbacteria)]|nr:hypothetical protein [Candidatus Stahlbacteria bacterium]